MVTRVFTAVRWMHIGFPKCFTYSNFSHVNVNNQKTVQYFTIPGMMLDILDQMVCYIFSWSVLKHDHDLLITSLYSLLEGYSIASLYQLIAKFASVLSSCGLTCAFRSWYSDYSWSSTLDWLHLRLHFWPTDLRSSGQNCILETPESSFAVVIVHWWCKSTFIPTVWNLRIFPWSLCANIVPTWR